MAPFVIDEIKLIELPNLLSVGVKPVGHCCLAFVFLIVAKPRFHRREVGWGARRTEIMEMHRITAAEFEKEVFGASYAKGK